MLSYLLIYLIFFSIPIPIRSYTLLSLPSLFISVPSKSVPILCVPVLVLFISVQSDPFLGLSRLFGTSPTRLRSFPFLGSSWLFDAFPYRVISILIISLADPITAFPLRFLAIVSIPPLFCTSPRLYRSMLFHHIAFRSIAVQCEAVRIYSFPIPRHVSRSLSIAVLCDQVHFCSDSQLYIIFFFLKRRAYVHLCVFCRL